MNDRTEAPPAPRSEARPPRPTLPATPAAPAMRLPPSRHDLRPAGYAEDGSYDIARYIRDSTHQIWDQKFIGKIYDYYDPQAVVHTSNGDIYGRDQVIKLTTIRQGAFPDTRDWIEDVIWRRNPDGTYDTSMRWVYMGVNTGWSQYGPPTGRKVAVRGVANCVIKDNRVVKEWVSYNELSLLRQLGLDPRTVLEGAIRGAISNSQSAGAETARAFGEVENVIAQTTPPPIPAMPPEFDPEAFIRRAYHEIWNWRYIGRIDDYFAPNHLCHASSDRELYGLGDYKHDVLSRLAAFPDMRTHVDDVYWTPDEEKGGVRIAVRWTQIGTHEGPGMYGPPTGRRVKIMGISHHMMRDGLLQEEFSEWGEFATLKQIYGGGAPIPQDLLSARPVHPARVAEEEGR
ncbi:ester cyclase (plasmid) [Roseomonas sp. OT10]|uniref:ester cyclase n=1 Tax=Roseomonas cutis TaxID=2897332 RepID=UPI001E424628|nr:ester cyclase [Roseomonas sp. OT10]UFN51656.1 ester cyclase [Roseomonas sp. OT10]